MEQKLLFYLVLMTLYMGIHLKLLEKQFGYFSKYIPCEILRIYTLVYVNNSFSYEGSLYFCISG